MQKPIEVPNNSLKDRLINLLLEIRPLRQSMQDRSNILLRNLPPPLTTILRSEVPSTDITSIVDTVSTWGTLQETMEPALLTVMGNVRHYVEGTGLEIRLKALERELRENFLSISIEIPIATLAMTRGEVEALNRGEVNKVEAEYQTWLKLKAVLGDKNALDLIANYDAEPDSWRPFPDVSKSIRQIVDEIIDQLNQHRQKSQKRPFKPRHLSNLFLNQENSFVPGIIERGGVLIVDALSMCYPRLKKAFNHIRKPGPNTAIIVISCPDTDATAINTLLADQIYKTALRAAFEGFINIPTTPYEFGADNLNRLRRWLHSILPGIEAGASLTAEQKEYLDKFADDSPEVLKYITGNKL